MKRTHTIILAAVVFTATSLLAQEGQTPATADGTASPPEAVDSAAVIVENSTNAPLRMNFRGAPLNLVLDYLSDAAGFIINKETEVRGTVDVWSKHPLTREEAVELLNSVLRKNGYAVTRNGRILTIVSLDAAKTADLEIVSGNDPESVERSDEIVTQIIPVQRANATQLMNNLQVLLPTTATLSVNESANSLILVSTKTDIRRMLKIIKALDTSIASVSSIRVFPLEYADARQLATVVQQLFAPTTTGPAGNNPRAQMFNMFRGGGPGGPAAPGAQAGQAAGGAAASRVVATADEYSNSLVVSAAPDLMATIEDMVEQIDKPISEITELRVFRLMNADPVELAEQFTQVFPDESRTGGNNGGNRNQRFRFGGNQGNNAAQSSDRSRLRTRVIAVPDQRTSSLIVTAAADMMPQIEEMITQLDASPAKKEKVAVFELQNADPADVYQILQDLFNRNNTMRVNNANNRNSMVGQNNPLNRRATQQQQQQNNRMSNFGNTGRAGGN